jgi:hypothetical protein
LNRYRHVVAVTLLAGLGLFAFACGGGGNAASPGAPGQSAPGSNATDVPLKTGPGTCEVKVTGDLTVDYKGQGGSSAVGSDYWLTDDEIRSAVSVLSGLGNNASDAEKKKAVDAAMKADPRLYLLILNCISGSGDAKNSLSLLPSGSSKYADVPFKPGQYTIPKGGLLGGADKPGEFSVLVSLGKDAYQVSEDGKLNITKFDKTGIAGSFSFRSTAAQRRRPPPRWA